MSNNFSLLSPQNTLFSSAPESKFSIEFNEALQLFGKYPDIEKSITGDQDAHARKKKALRLKDKMWERCQYEKRYAKPLFHDNDAETNIQEEDLLLSDGCPRMKPVMVYAFLWIRGLLGGSPKNQAVQTMLLESRTFELFLRNCGAIMPGASTVIDNINLISKKTMRVISKAQLAQITSEGLDDFEQCVMDSTSSKGNSERPTESNMIARISARIYRCGKELTHFGIIGMHERNFPKLIKEMDVIAKNIALDCGKKGSITRRKTNYNKLISKATSARKKFEAEMVKIDQRVASIELKPSQKIMLIDEVNDIKEDIKNLQKVMDCARRRVMKGEKVEASDKVMSLSDADVACIVKGQRDTVFGYKPQLARSEKGFVSVLVLPQGNAADSGQLDTIINTHISNTQVLPKTVSTDDGYANKAIRDKWLEDGIEVFSISGAKGKKITSEEDWTSDIYRNARNNRSAVESLMFCIKFGYNFGRNVRRGIEAVRQEMMEKVLAYNFARMVTIRQRQQQAA